MASPVVRRCRHCCKPLKATARSDAKFCSKACAQAERRWQRHYAEAVEFGFLLVEGRTAEVSRRWPACGRRFVPGHGHRRDKIFCRPACRQAAYRARRAQSLREAVTPAADVEPPGSRYTPLTSSDKPRLVGAFTKDFRK